MTTTWSVVVFAHNEAANIAATITSILADQSGVRIEVLVLANGCHDRTATIVRELAGRADNLGVVEIPLADKAAAWNHYVHEIAAKPPFNLVEMHVFVDGDVQVEAGSLPALATALAGEPAANAAGALPTTGRDRIAWSQRMIANGTLAGGLYALRPSFVERIRERRIHIPQGLIGEDLLLSCLANSDLQPLIRSPAGGSRVVFAATAGFSFRSLSPWRLKDYRIYLRRLWRYSLRGVQFEMLYRWLLHSPPEALPPDVERIYLTGRPPSRLKWVGTTSLLRLLAVQRVRYLRASHSRQQR